MKNRKIGLTVSLLFHGIVAVATSLWVLRALPPKSAKMNEGEPREDMRIFMAAPKVKKKAVEPEKQPELPLPPPPVVPPPTPQPPAEPQVEPKKPAPIIVAATPSPVAKPKPQLKQAKPPTTAKTTAKPAPKPQQPASAAVAATNSGGAGNSAAQYSRRAPLSYPSSAKRLKQQGVAKLRVLINAAGKVEKVEIVSSTGFPSLDAAAITCAQRSSYRAALRNGSPISAWVDATFRFALD